MNKSVFPINDTFFSVQGEGYHTGKFAFFIRFGKCNLRCEFCDSKATWTKYRSYKTEEIFALLKNARSKTDFLILTGGEPTLYNLTDIIKFAKNLKFYITIETNGIIMPKWIQLLDWITVSPKTLISRTHIKKANELKFVITGDQSWNFMLSFMPFKPVFLMPVNNNKKIAKFIISKITENKLYKYVRLGAQIHKFYKLK